MMGNAGIGGGEPSPRYARDYARMRLFAVVVQSARFPLQGCRCVANFLAGLQLAVAAPASSAGELPEEIRFMWKISAIGAPLVVGILLGAPNVALASLDSCGGVYLVGEGQCKYVPTEECTTECETVAMTTSCAAKLYAECEASCTASATVECEETCAPVCNTDCETIEMDSEKPPNAMGLCMSDCQQTCNDKCADAENVGRCRSSCAHTCGEKCENRCGEIEDTVACETKCEPVCTGSCEGEANAECQIQCQSETFTECETELVEKCETECTQTGGAIFCDGQFLNHTDLEDCAAELEAELNISVDVTLDVDVSVGDDASGDDDDDDVNVGCSMAPGSTPSSGGKGGMLALGGLMLWQLSRRRTSRARA